MEYKINRSLQNFSCVSYSHLLSSHGIHIDLSGRLCCIKKTFFLLIYWRAIFLRVKKNVPHYRLYDHSWIDGYIDGARVNHVVCQSRSLNSERACRCRVHPYAARDAVHKLPLLRYPSSPSPPRALRACVRRPSTPNSQPASGRRARARRTSASPRDCVNDYCAARARAFPGCTSGARRAGRSRDVWARARRAGFSIVPGLLLAADGLDRTRRCDAFGWAVFNEPFSWPSKGISSL